MISGSWIEEFPGAVIVCDPKGIILEMNEAAVITFAKDGGKELIGKDMLACHPEVARIKVEALLKEGKRNVYTIEKNGVKKLIYQSPWFRGGKYAGFVEFSLVIPEVMPHFTRS
jgi:hypothetical protein